jgi:hypothetical protein
LGNRSRRFGAIVVNGLALKVYKLVCRVSSRFVRKWGEYIDINVDPKFAFGVLSRALCTTALEKQGLVDFQVPRILPCDEGYTTSQQTILLLFTLVSINQEAAFPARWRMLNCYSRPCLLVRKGGTQTHTHTFPHHLPMGPIKLRFIPHLRLNYLAAYHPPHYHARLCLIHHSHPLPRYLHTLFVCPPPIYEHALHFQCLLPATASSGFSTQLSW